MGKKWFALVMWPVLTSAFCSWWISFQVWNDLPEAFLHPTRSPFLGFSVHSNICWRISSYLGFLGFPNFSFHVNICSGEIRYTLYVGSSWKVLWLWEVETRLEWTNGACFWNVFMHTELAGAFLDSLGLCVDRGQASILWPRTFNFI